jgi:hypothetical protein
MHRLIIILGAVLCFVSAARAQSLTGTILDPQGGSVPKGQIKLYVRENGVQLNATSDSQGKYRFQRLAPGDYIIEAEAEGFARTAAQSIQLEAGRTLNLDIPLKLAGVAQKIVVTAAGSAQAGEETSKAISTVGWQEIQARDEFSIAEALRTTAGLRYQQLAFSRRQQSANGSWSKRRVDSDLTSRPPCRCVSAVCLALHLGLRFL